MTKKQFTALNMRDESYQVYVDEMARANKLSFRINQTEPMTDAARELINELFEGRLPETSNIFTPLQIDNGKNMAFGENVFINHSLTCMAIGGIEIEDNVMIGPQVTLLTANHEFEDHWTLLVGKIQIKNNAWIGARATILPGIIIGENAVVAGGAVVTKDVEANTVVGGNPARVLKRLD